MGYYAGLDMSLKRTSTCVAGEAGAVVWPGSADTQPEMIAGALDRWRESLEEVGSETG